MPWAPYRCPEAPYRYPEADGEPCLWAGPFHGSGVRLAPASPHFRTMDLQRLREHKLRNDLQQVGLLGYLAWVVGGAPFAWGTLMGVALLYLVNPVGSPVWRRPWRSWSAFRAGSGSRRCFPGEGCRTPRCCALTRRPRSASPGSWSWRGPGADAIPDATCLAVRGRRHRYPSPTPRPVRPAGTSADSGTGVAQCRTASPGRAGSARPPWRPVGAP